MRIRINSRRMRLEPEREELIDDERLKEKHAREFMSEMIML